MRRSLVLVLVMGVAGCSNEAAPAGPQEPSVVVGETAIDVSTGTFQVPAGEIMECFYTSLITDEDFAVAAVEARQGSAGHHLAVWFTATTRPPGHHVCDEAEMATWRYVGAAGGEAGGGEDQSLPEGLAARLPAGMQLVMQSHYINTTGAEMGAVDDVTLQLVDPEEVVAFANQYVINDMAFEVPARAEYQSSSVCRVERDLNVAFYMGHMHSHGRHFKLEQLVGDTDEGTVIYEHEWDEGYATHPPVER